MSTIELDNKFIKLEKLSNACDPNIVEAAVDFANEKHEAYITGKINGEEDYKLERRSRVVISKFINSCSCKQKE